ncbi:MAG: BrnT family toxin [Agitococcus sp.]|nr:BrnT family toxin [Agitococcus sp.]
MRIEWDKRKAAANIKKHGVYFEDAALVFDDPYQYARLDRVEGNEARWQTLGKAGGAVILLVAHTHIDSDGQEIVRIISARRAERKERKTYEEHAIK